jgi:hypothetical protein
MTLSPWFDHQKRTNAFIVSSTGATSQEQTPGSRVRELALSNPSQTEFGVMMSEQYSLKDPRKLYPAAVPRPAATGSRPGTEDGPDA